MKAKEIQELINFISDSGMDEVNIETDQFKLSVKKNSGTVQVQAAPVAAAPVPVAAPAPVPAAAPSADSASGATASEETGNYVEIKSPMIGTFYRSPNPESGPFVNVGDKVSKGQAVCIVEAMKLFNEIESEISGTIVKVLVEDKSPIEYDQPLFLVDPS